MRDKPTQTRARRPSVACPTCAHPFTTVARTEPLADAVRRVRRCKACRRSFVTREAVVGASTDTAAGALAKSVAELAKLLQATPSVPQLTRQSN